MGNLVKSSEKHGIENTLVESVFKDEDILALGEQYQPSVNEIRYGVIGKASDGAILFVVFTIRRGKIRPISSRMANQKEKDVYGKKIR